MGRPIIDHSPEGTRKREYMRKYMQENPQKSKTRWQIHKDNRKAVDDAVDTAALSRPATKTAFTAVDLMSLPAEKFIPAASGIAAGEFFLTNIGSLPASDEVDQPFASPLHRGGLGRSRIVCDERFGLRINRGVK